MNYARCGVEGHAVDETYWYSKVRPNALDLIPEGRVRATDRGRDRVMNPVQQVNPAAALQFSKIQPRSVNRVCR